MTGLVNSNQKSRGLVSSTGVLSKGNTRGNGRQGKAFDHNCCWGISTINLYFLVILWVCMRG